MEEGLKAAFGGFLKHMEVRQYAEASRRLYAGNLLKFFAFLGEKGVKDVRRVGKDVLRAYLLYLSAQRESGMGWAAVCTRVRCVKRFFEYLEATQQILVNPAEAIHEPKRESRLPRVVLTQEQAERLLEVPDVTTPAGLRDRAMLETFYSTGIRLGEMLALKVDDLNLEDGLLRVNLGKGAKDRVVPMGKQAVAFLKAYLADARPGLVKQSTDQAGVLWVNSHGDPVSKQCAELMVRACGRKAGLPVGVSPHVLRHTFATLMVRNGADIMLVSQLLGHSEVSITQIYARVAGVDMKKTHGEAHPRERETEEEAPPVILWKRSGAHA